MEPKTTTDDTYAKHHAVQFYGSDNSLFTTVSGFLSEGLVAKQPAVLIATEDHRTGILSHLAARLIDVDRAIRERDLVMLDANEMLGRFMDGDTPNPALFEQHVGTLIDEILKDRQCTMVRAYGEMVDVLWKDGRADAALALELLWNKLALKHSFALMCGYAMGSFYKRSEQMHDVCALHNHVIESDSNVVPFEARRTARSA